MKKGYRLWALAITAIITGCAEAPSIPNDLLAKQDYEPFDSARITKAQWESFHETIAEKYKYLRSVGKETKVETFIVKGSSHLVYVFTLPDNPAHPALIIRNTIENAPNHVPGRAILSRPYRMIEDVRLLPERIFLIGYFAGDEEAFKKMILNYEGLNALLRKGKPPFVQKTF